MRVCQGETNQQFAAWVRDLSCNAALAGSITLPPGIGQFQSQEPFYGHIYPPQLLAQVHTTLNTFRDRAILTIRNNTMAEINEAILARLHGSPSTFHSINSIEQNGEEDHIELPPVELLQAFNPASLPPSKLSLKVGTPVILLQNLYPKEGLCNGTYIVITRLGQRCIKTQMLSGSFHGQLWLIPRIKLTSTDGELPFIVSRR